MNRWRLSILLALISSTLLLSTFRPLTDNIPLTIGANGAVIVPSKGWDLHTISDSYNAANARVTVPDSLEKASDEGKDTLIEELEESFSFTKLGYDTTEKQPNSPWIYYINNNSNNNINTNTTNNENHIITIHNKSNQITKIIQANGQNNVNRTTQITQVNRSKTYDMYGEEIKEIERLKQVTTAKVVTSYSYDILGRISRKIHISDGYKSIVQYLYDEHDRIVQIIYSGDYKVDMGWSAIEYISPYDDSLPTVSTSFPYNSTNLHSKKFNIRIKSINHNTSKEINTTWTLQRNQKADDSKADDNIAWMYLDSPSIITICSTIGIEQPPDNLRQQDLAQRPENSQTSRYLEDNSVSNIVGSAQAEPFHQAITEPSIKIQPVNTHAFLHRLADISFVGLLVMIFLVRNTVLALFWIGSTIILQAFIHWILVKLSSPHRDDLEKEIATLLRVARYGGLGGFTIWTAKELVELAFHF